jgi:hypothetical protein
MASPVPAGDVRRLTHCDFAAATTRKRLPDGRHAWQSQNAALAAFPGRIVLDENTIESAEAEHPYGLADCGDAKVTATGGQVRAQNCRPITTFGVRRCTSERTHASHYSRIGTT